MRIRTNTTDVRGRSPNRGRSLRGSRWTCAACLATFLPVLVSWGCRDELPPKPQATSISERPVPPPQPAPTSAPQNDLTLNGRRVLLVYSYHPEYPWVITITEGVKAALQGTGVELETFYMDTKRHTDQAWKTDSGERAKKKVDEYRPDILLTIDDDAQQYFAKAYVNTRLPVVFCGVDADPSKYGYPAANVTGVIERPHFKQSLALAATLRPIKRIAVMSCHDSTSIAALGFMKQEQLDVDVTEWLMVDDFDQWKKAVARFNTTVDALVVRSYQAVKRPGTQENVSPDEVGRWTAENATIPTIAFHDFEIRDGMLAGVVKSGQEYGRRAAEYAIKILKGASPSTLPVTRTNLGIPMINRNTAHRLGISLTNEMTRNVRVVPED